MRVLIALVVAFIGAALADQQHRIVGGSPTAIEEYNYVVSTAFSYLGINHRQLCAGTLITPVAVVSVAHCYVGYSPNQWRVRTGSTFAQFGGHVMEISQLFLHENYNANLLTNDISVIRLTQAVLLSASIGTSRIAGPNYNIQDNSLVDTAGWGTASPGGESSPILNHVSLNVINHDECTQRYANLKTQPGFQNWPAVTPQMLCVGALDVGGKDACEGDKGGPIIHQRDILVGVVSWGFGCGNPTYPRVVTRISSFTNWIFEKSVA